MLQGFYYPHLTGEETEAQAGEVTCTGHVDRDRGGTGVLQPGPTFSTRPENQCFTLVSPATTQLHLCKVAVGNRK